jgi:nucleoside-diphosphate-sugar epimerase
VGLRFFNVYGPDENEKGDYASIVSLLLKAWRSGEKLLVYGDGEQARDLINVKDAARVTVDILEKGGEPVYNVGTGVATTYTRVAEMIDKANVSYVPNPLRHYQYYTRAETGRLRTAIGAMDFLSVEEGLAAMRDGAE